MNLIMEILLHLLILQINGIKSYLIIICRNCPSMEYIYDTGACTSSWAIVPSSIASDRFCIHLGKKFELSSEELLSCCSNCGNCMGGSYSIAWNYLNVYILYVI